MWSHRLSGLACLLAGLCLFGWWAGLPLLTTLGGSNTPMMPNTALMSLLCGCALLLQARTPARAARRWPIGLAWAALVLATLTLLEHAFRVDLGIDGWLLPSASSSQSVRPVPQTALSFMLLAMAILSERLCSDRVALVRETTALAAASVALVALFGLLFSAQALYNLPLVSPTGMSLPAMLNVLALAAAAMAVNSPGPVMTVLTSDELGAVAGRRLLYGLLAAPLLAAALQASVTRGWIGGPVALALGVFVALMGMAGAIVSNAGRLNRALQRKRSELEQLRQAAVVFESSNEAILITDARAAILAVNSAYETLSGYSAAEVIGRNPRFQKSGRQDAAFYQRLWLALQHEGAWQGEVWNQRRNGEVYAVWQSISAVRDDAGVTTHYVSMLSDITAIKQAEERLHHLAHHDPLTQLPNRLLFGSTLEQAIARANRHSRRLALLFIDLDHFKIVNDTLGHPVGDQLLQTVAQRLRDTVRAQDVVARLGGDEFTVLIEEVASREDVATLARKLISVVNEPLLLEGREVSISSSVGIAIFPDDAATSVDLTRAADAALYRAKANGRHTFGFYTEELTRLATERLAIETRLRQAVPAGELRLHYQPQFSLVDKRLVGFEALVRWQHSEEGLLLPARFIQIAEESNLIQAVSAWVIREACRQAREWLDLGLQPQRISVNVSGREFLRDHVIETISEAMHVNALDGAVRPMELEVEVTETVLHASHRSAETLQSLRLMGVRVAIDDFGTGYSSLALLKQLPIDALKIDQMFVRTLPEDLDSLAIARAIIAMAHSLGLQVVAEGVETEAQRDCLQALGCDQIQGYLTGRAVPPEQARHWLGPAMPQGIRR